jgi:hypothetical protein
MTFTADFWIEVALRKKEFCTQNSFPSVRAQKRHVVMSEAKLLLKSSELPMVHEHVVNRWVMLMHRPTANDYLARQKRQKYTDSERDAFVDVFLVSSMLVWFIWLTVN